MVRAVFSPQGAITPSIDGALVGITDLNLVSNGALTTLFAATRGDGWLSAFDVGQFAGQTQIEAHWRIEPDLLQLETTDLVLHQTGTQTTIYMAGLNDVNLIGVDLSLSTSGSPFRGEAEVTNQRDLSTFTELELIANSDAGIAALRGGGLVNVSFGNPNQLSVTDITQTGDMQNARASDLITATHNGQTYAFASYGSADTIGMFTQQAGTLSHVADITTEDGLWVDNPGALAVTEAADGRLYLVVAGVGSSSLSVMQIAEDGRSFKPVDHITDTLDTRFSNASHLSSVTIGDQNFILAAGNDQGISLLTVLPGGRIQHIDAMPATIDTPLRGITSLDAMATPDGIRVWASTEAAPFLSEFSIALPNLGGTQISAAGGGPLNGTTRDDVLIGGNGADVISGANGNDMIVDGAGSDRLSGGSGADTFILMQDDQRDTITDFDVTADRIDLSDYTQLDEIGTLAVSVRNWGAEIRIGDDVLEVHSANGAQLNADDFTPSVLIQGNRAEIDPSLYPTGGSDPNPDPDQNPVPDPNPPPQNDSPVNDAPNRVTSPAEPRLDLSWRTGDTRGGDSAEIYTGFGQADRMFGAGGNDTMNGGAGNDVISGDADNDLIDGADGNDILAGGSGSDTILGADDLDTIFGHSGADQINGGTDADLLIGGDGNDTVTGDAGDDLIWGSAGGDRLTGGSGNDVISAGTNSGFTLDAVWGGTGNDTLFGNDGTDLLLGDAGNDLLDGGNGQDKLFGGDGNDILHGAADTDRLFGGDGDDQLSGGDGDDGLLGHSGNDTLWGGDGNDRLFGSSGDDVLDGSAGRDTLSGDSGRDTLWGGDGNDLLEGGVDADEFVFANSHGDDVIADFDPDNPDEVLNFVQISDLNSFEDVLAASSQAASGLSIRTDVDSSVLLTNISRTDLSENDFIF